MIAPQMSQGSFTAVVAALSVQLQATAPVPNFQITVPLMPRLTERNRAIADLRRYVDMCEEGGFISARVRDAIWYTWQRLNSAVKDNLEVPDACPGSNGEILLTWDQGNDHFEVEIGPSTEVEFFYQNTKLGDSWDVAANDPRGQLEERVTGVLELFKLAKADAIARP